jgi:hypothetical protein
LLDNNHCQILISVQIIEINNVPCISFDALNLTASNDKDNLHLTPNLKRQGEILKEGNILSLALEVAKICCKDFKPNTQTFCINNIYP